MIRKIYTSGIIALSLLLLGGCANEMMMDEKMQAMKMEMMMMVDEATRKANTADYNAGVAKSMADDAMTRLNKMESKMMMRGMKHDMMK